jgi:phenylpropionate dioxygenase-like ring-hydroxylating dioxygenase large terminal subunit
MKVEPTVPTGSRYARLPEIPRARYADAALYSAEIAHIFRKSWLMVAHLSDFAEAGSYRTIDLPFAPVVLVRGKDTRMRAFINACAHRGAAVVRAAEGCAKALMCPYHGWVYDLDGSLIGAPERHNFPDFDRKRHSLEGVRCELWGSFVFVNLDANARPLLEELQPLVSRYSELMEAPMRLVAKETFEFPCNWKIVAEAFREAYHIRCVHPGTVAPLVIAPDTVYEFYPGGHDTVLSPYCESFLKFSTAGMQDAKGYRTDLADMPLMARQQFRENLVAINFFPSYTFGTLQNGFGYINALPLAVNRTRVVVEVWGMDWGMEPRPAEWDSVAGHFLSVVREDLANLSSIQLSVEASSSRGVVLSDVMERGLYELHAEIDRRIGADVPPSLRVADTVRDFVM